MSQSTNVATPVVVLQVGDEWRRYTDPVRVIVAGAAGELLPAIREIERAVEEEGLIAAGYLAYEAAAAYGLATHPTGADAPPLLWFGLFKEWQTIEPPAPAGDYTFGEWQPSLDRATYDAAIARVHEAIAAGDIRQVNYTFHLRASFAGDPWALFAGLAAAQRSSHCAYIDLGRFVICSASPELFFRLDGSTIESRPMKGTAPRGLSSADDRRQIEWLRQSGKNRAENKLAVDLVRDDFSHIARPGSIHVPDWFTVERYPTVLQMTSTVRAETDASLADILAATYSCASIAGAPRAAAMRVINELEPEPRGVYTGAIGMIAPGRRMLFNVAIRTAVIDRERGRVDYGVGSGVGPDSDATAEYEECLLKASVLEKSRQTAIDFSLLESLRWSPGEGYYLMKAHLERMRASADYFMFPFDGDLIQQQLFDTAMQLTEPTKVRLLVDRHGRSTVKAQLLPVAGGPSPLRVGLAKEPVSSADLFLYHKTTRRWAYEIARASRPDCNDVILWNERGELTESSAANIVLELDGRLLTPPVTSGLLAGTLRGHLLAGGRITERVLGVDDLARATRLWLINSVRGWQPAVWQR